jgi:hypothetical protein
MRLLALVMMWTMSCAPAPLCGNDVVEEGETSSTCCEDVPCEVGSCGIDHGCVLPWQQTCAVAGCVDDGPLQCSDDPSQPPSSDCVGCGCPDNGACLRGACVAPDVRDQERNEGVVSDLLDDEDYVALLRLITRGQAITLDESKRQLDQRRRDDPRRIVRIIGVDAMDGELGARLLVDGRNLDLADDTCALLQDQDGLYPEARLQMSLPVDQVDDVTCLYPGQFARCVLPQAAACLRVAGRLAERLMVVGAAAYDAVDDGLLRHAVRSGRAQWLVRMGDVAALYQDAVDVLDDESFRDVSSGRLIRVVANEPDGVWWVHVVPEDGRPHRTLSFRALWADAQVRSFIEGNDILPTDCTFTVGGGVDVECRRGAAVLEARLNLDHAVLDVTLSGE